MDNITNNAEQIISGISDLFEDLNDYTEGPIKESLKKIKQLDEKNKQKKLIIHINNKIRE